MTSKKAPSGVIPTGAKRSGEISSPDTVAPLITFIIPVYKALPWLERSLSSILNAEKKAPLPIEILICDDASPDDTGRLVDRLAESDPRIIPLHNEKNGSVCYSRNRCLDLAKGKWICFVDQDDVLDENAFEVFAKTLDEESQIIYYGFEDFYEETPSVSSRAQSRDLPATATTHPVSSRAQSRDLPAAASHPVSSRAQSRDLPAAAPTIPMGDGNPEASRVFTGEEIKKLQWDCLCRYKDSKPLISYRLLPVPWGKLYRRDFLNEYGVRFREGLHREEDIGFNLTALAHCTRVKSCPYPLYHYRRSLDTQSHTYRPEIRRETDETLAWYREIIAEHYPDDPRMEELYRFRELWGTLYNEALGCGHADNPKPYRERKQDFRALFGSGTLDAKKALDPKMIRRLDPLHRILATLTRRKMFGAIWLLGKLEPLTYKLRIR